MGILLHEYCLNKVSLGFHTSDSEAEQRKAKQKCRDAHPSAPPSPPQTGRRHQHLMDLSRGRKVLYRNRLAIPFAWRSVPVPEWAIVLSACTVPVPVPVLTVPGGVFLSARTPTSRKRLAQH